MTLGEKLFAHTSMNYIACSRWQQPIRKQYWELACHIKTADWLVYQQFNR